MEGEDRWGEMVYYVYKRTPWEERKGTHSGTDRGGELLLRDGLFPL